MCTSIDSFQAEMLQVNLIFKSCVYICVLNKSKNLKSEVLSKNDLKHYFLAWDYFLPYETGHKDSLAV